MDAMSARLVIAGSNDATSLRRATDGNRFIKQLGIVTHLDRCIEAVTIAMDDFTHARPGPGVCGGP